MIDKIIERLEDKKLEHLKLCVYPAHDKLDEAANETVEACNIGLDEAIDIVKQVAEEENNGWIRCSDRLPEIKECQRNSGWFFATLDNGFALEMHFNGSDWTTHGNTKRNDVIAWQNTPQPYKEG